MDGPQAGWAPTAAQFLAVLLCAVLARSATTVPRIEVLEGDGAINNIRLHRAKEPVVRVVDQDGHPIPNVAVTFILPGKGAGGTFGAGQSSLTVMTDDNGHGQHPADECGARAGRRVVQNHSDRGADWRRGRRRRGVRPERQVFGNHAGQSECGDRRGQPELWSTLMTCLITRSIALAALAAGAVWAQPLTIATTSPLPQATIGAAYTQTFSATGGSGTGYTWTATGLPGPWLTMNPGGVLSGTPPLTAVTSTFMVQVTDSASNTASGSFTLPVALSITTASPLPTGTVGVSYSQSVAAAGGSGTYTWSVSAGLLPAGLTLNAASGGISGQPTTAGPASFTIQVTDSNQATATEPFTMTIDPAIVITTSSPLPAGTVGVNYSQTLAATGGSGTYTWAGSVGSLPGGLTLNSTTGLIGGQPTTATTASFTIQATDSNQATASKQFALTINTGIVITTASPLPQGTVGVNYSQTLSATGGSGTYTWAVSVGSLPGGLTLNATTGLISGQPTTAIAANFTIKATDTNQDTASKQFALTVNAAIVITTASPLPQGTVGVNYSQALAATGGSGTYTWSVSAGSLPGGLTLNSTTGLISGQPTTAIAANFTIQATDTNQATASKQFALTVNPAIVITTSSPLPAGTVNVNYSQTVAATGGSGTYTWAVPRRPSNFP